MPLLSQRVIYSIYKDCLEELNRCGIIEGCSFDVLQLDPSDPHSPLQYVERAAEPLSLPSFDEMLLEYQPFAQAIPKQLAELAQASEVRPHASEVLRRTWHPTDSTTDIERTNASATACYFVGVPQYPKSMLYPRSSRGVASWSDGGIAESGGSKNRFQSLTTRDGAGGGQDHRRSCTL